MRNKMNGFQILKTAIDDVFKNLTDALAISGLLWIGVVAAQVVFVEKFGGMSGLEIDDPASIPVGLIKWTLLLNLATLAISLWVAVAWHRFIILGERAISVVPPMNGARVLAYFRTSLLIGVIVVAIVLAASIVLSPLATAGGPSLVVFGYVALMVPMTYVVYRISPALPAAAIGNGMGIGDAWRKTAPIKASVFQAGLFATLGGFALQQVGVLFSFNALLATLYSLASGWVMLMVGVSVFSTIYKLANHETAR
ncbi:hypothetical protein [Celeribacter marinus]|uniref:hypothetical protein n=1 Tax=Celeribacter marinus TaxID=1397108 RepID=UPI003F6B338B